MNALNEELNIALWREKSSTAIVFKSCKSGTRVLRLNHESIHLCIQQVVLLVFGILNFKHYKFQMSIILMR